MARWPRFQAVSFSLVCILVSKITRHITRDLTSCEGRQTQHNIFVTCGDRTPVYAAQGKPHPSITTPEPGIEASGTPWSGLPPPGT